MGIYHYLVNESNKSIFELGRGNWSASLAVFQTSIKKVYEHLYFPYHEGGMDIPLYQFPDKELLILAIKEEFEDSALVNDEEYIYYVAESILSFCGNEPVHFVNNDDELIWELEQQGYKETASRYII